jgi:hypothetical protein
MKIILTAEESEQYFYNALCNGLGYMCSGYGLSFKYKESNYKSARKNILKNKFDTNEVVCFEDVLMQILRDGNTLTLIDEEGGDESWSVVLDDVHKRVSEAPIDHLVDMLNGNDDAVTADVILQSVFIGEVMFG